MRRKPAETVRQVARWAAALPAVWLLAVFLTAPSPTPLARVLAGGMLAVSCADSVAALLLVAVLAPLGPLLATPLDGPVSFVDALVLAFLIGWLARRRDARPGPRVPLAAGAAAALLVCDLLFTIRPATAAHAVTLIEGLGLTVATIELLRRRPVVAVRLPMALVAGMSVSAMSSAGRVASGSAMVACVAVGMALREHGRKRLAWGIAGAIALVGLSAPTRAAQNTYERFATEAGWAGAALFVAFLAVALWGVGQGVAASPRDARLLGCTAGILAFIGGCFVGDPLRLPHAAVPFWLLFGLTMALERTTPAGGFARRSLRGVCATTMRDWRGQRWALRAVALVPALVIATFLANWRVSTELRLEALVVLIVALVRPAIGLMLVALIAPLGLIASSVMASIASGLLTIGAAPVGTLARQLARALPRFSAITGDVNATAS